MRNFLSPEGPLMSFITKIAYSAYLNILWFVCCLPIVTIVLDGILNKAATVQSLRIKISIKKL